MRTNRASDPGIGARAALREEGSRADRLEQGESLWVSLRPYTASSAMSSSYARFSTRSHSWAMSSCHGRSTQVRAHHLPWRWSSICCFSARSQCSTASWRGRDSRRYGHSIVPRSIERSTYVLLSSLLLALICWQWRPIPAPSGMCQPRRWARVCWPALLARLAGPLARDLHDQPFRPLRAASGVPAPARARVLPAAIHAARALQAGAPSDHARLPDRLLGDPRMSLGHCIFALATTGYILVGIALEERDLVRVPRGAVSGLSCPGAHAVADLRQPQQEAIAR